VEKNSLGPKKISPAAVRLLMEQKWTGNVRALRNAIEQSAVMSDGETITPEDFPFAPAAPAIPAPPPTAGFHLSLPEDWLDLKSALREVTEAAERQIIARALRAHAGNRTHTAAALGLSRRALIGKIQVYNL
jgi:two-component system response regulator AtoC